MVSGGYQSPALTDTDTRSTFTAQEYAVYKRDYARRPQIILLIERFYHQLRYGCTSDTCSQPTCHSHSSQRTNPPYRRPTSVTARALATYFASQDNPLRLLCQNVPAPRSDPFDIAFPVSKSLYGKLNKHGEPDQSTKALAEWYAKCEFEEWMENQSMSNTSVDLQAPYPYRSDHAIDNRSFAQKFFSCGIFTLAPLLRNPMHPLGSIVQANHILCIPEEETEASDQPRDDVRKAMNDRWEVPQHISSLLLGAESWFPLLQMAYHNTDQLHTSNEQIASFYLATNLSDYLPVEPRVNLSQVFPRLVPILADVSKLIFHGRCVESADRASQPFAILFFEFLALYRHCGVDPSLTIQQLVSPVKTVFHDSEDENKVPPAVAAHVCALALSSLSASVFNQDKPLNKDMWKLFESFRQMGHVFWPGHKISDTDASIDRLLLNDWTIAYDEEVSKYLMRMVILCFASWSYRSTMVPPRSAGINEPSQHLIELPSEFKRRLLDFLRAPRCLRDITHQLVRNVIEWSRTMFLREWPGGHTFSWSTDVGSSIDFMNWLYGNRVELGIDASNFTINHMLDHMDVVEAAQDWMRPIDTRTTGHFFDYPWLFDEYSRITIIRAVHTLRMYAAFEDAAVQRSVMSKMQRYIPLSAGELLDGIQMSAEAFIVLNIRRDNILGDAFSEIWSRREKEIFRPLRVKMGMEEGEEGVDMGGVQQEFFRLAIAEVLKPGYGMFIVDPQTQMTWFQPKSTAPLYHYTLIGILFGLAFYNGIPLGVTFPLMFYRHLLATNKAKQDALKESRLEDIQDGWEDLYNGFRKLLSYREGDVTEAFYRGYAFEFESAGTKYQVDMLSTGRDTEWPAGVIPLDLEQEITMVTNENREQFVKDYIFWLTNKSIAAQLEAFSAGFYLPLQKKALGVLMPEDMRLLVQGHNDIDVSKLQKITTYVEFDPANPRIVDFWEILYDMNLEELQQLLEFVTASPRVPVHGIESMKFTIQRNGNHESDDKLPTSMTCFSILLLPEYSSKEILERKLKVAISYGIGFGTQ